MIGRPRCPGDVVNPDSDNKEAVKICQEKSEIEWHLPCFTPNVANRSRIRMLPLA